VETTEFKTLGCFLSNYSGPKWWQPDLKLSVVLWTLISWVRVETTIFKTLGCFFIKLLRSKVMTTISKTLGCFRPNCWGSWLWQPDSKLWVAFDRTVQVRGYGNQIQNSELLPIELLRFVVMATRFKIWVASDRTTQVRDYGNQIQNFRLLPTELLRFVFMETRFKTLGCFWPTTQVHGYGNLI